MGRQRSRLAARSCRSKIGDMQVVSNCGDMVWCSLLRAHSWLHRRTQNVRKEVSKTPTPRGVSFNRASACHLDVLNIGRSTHTRCHGRMWTHCDRWCRCGWAPDKLSGFASLRLEKPRAADVVEMRLVAVAPLQTTDVCLTPPSVSL